MMNCPIMNCPGCGKEMSPGYLRGSRSYALMWTDDAFKATALPTGESFWLCRETDLERPAAYLCRECRKLVVDF